MNNTTGANIRRLREHKSWTQEQLAGAAGVDVRTVQRAEKGDQISAESLQALAGALDALVEMLRLEPKDVMRQVREFEKRYKFIALTRIERAYDLRNFIGSGAMELDYVALDDQQQRAVAEFEQALKDWTMIWGDLEPIQKHEAFGDIQKYVDELQALGLIVAAGTETLRLSSENVGNPFAMEFLYLMVSKKSEPMLTIARERNRKISFA
jgi:transcriptional regulator with XRE-family HTH domain